MALKFTCKCGKSYRAKGEQIGKRFRCKACGEQTIIRATDVAAPEPEIVQASLSPAPTTATQPMSTSSDAAAKPTEQPKKRSNRFVYLILAIVLTPGFLCIGTCGGCQYMLFSFGKGLTDSSVQTTLSNDPTVQEHIGEIESCHSSTIGMLFQSGANRNYVFHLKGSLGDGRATVLVPKQTTSTNQVLCFPQSLVTDDGNTYDLTKNSSGGIGDFFRKNMTNVPEAETKP